MAGRLKDALVAYLKTRPAVAALAGDRVSPYAAHQGEGYPRVTYHRQATDRGRTLESGSDGLPRSVVQVDAWARQDRDAVDLARAVADALDGFRGRWGGLAVQAAFLLNEADLEEPPAWAADEWVFRVSLDFEVWHEEEVALGPGVSSDETGTPPAVGVGEAALVFFGAYFG